MAKEMLKDNYFIGIGLFDKAGNKSLVWLSKKR
jgi:hypothetical protein